MNISVRERHVLLKAELSRFNINGKEHRKLSTVFFAWFGRAHTTAPLFIWVQISRDSGGKICYIPWRSSEASMSLVGRA
jgi:hypothetical protein